MPTGDYAIPNFSEAHHEMAKDALLNAILMERARETNVVINFVVSKVPISLEPALEVAVVKGSMVLVVYATVVEVVQTVIKNKETKINVKVVTD